MLVGRQGYWTSRITTVPLSEPVMMRVSSKHSRVQRVITGVCRMARSFCADGRTQGRRSAGAGGMGRYLLLTTYYLLLTTYYLLLTTYYSLLTSVRRSHILTRESKPLETTYG